MKRGMIFFAFAVVAILFIATVASIYAAEFNPQPEPPGMWPLFQEDFKSLERELAAAQVKLTGLKPGSHLMEQTLTGPHANMANLLQSIRTRVKGLEGTRGQGKGVLDICNQMKPKLDSLELFLKNFQAAVKQGDKPTAQGLLNQMGETVKGLQALLAK